MGRQSSPAVTDAASQFSCSATSSMTAGMAAQTSRTARPVSAAPVDLCKQIKAAFRRDEKHQVSS